MKNTSKTHGENKRASLRYMRKDYTFRPKSPLSANCTHTHTTSILKIQYSILSMLDREKHKKQNQQNKHDFDFTACKIILLFGTVPDRSNYVKKAQHVTMSLLMTNTTIVFQLASRFLAKRKGLAFFGQHKQL